MTLITKRILDDNKIPLRHKFKNRKGEESTYEIWSVHNKKKYAISRARMRRRKEGFKARVKKFGNKYVVYIHF